MSVFEHFIRSGLIAIIVFITNFSAGTAYSQVARQNLQVGKTSIVVNKVTANNRDDARQLSTNDPVYSLERITAGLDSHGEILLNDNTHILVGPGADVSLDDFVISDKGITSATINVLKGAFRFVSGKSPEGTFKIKTPLSTIGIRGTMFDIYVKKRGATDVILYSGKVNVCTSANRCRVLSRNCDIVRITSPRNIGFRKFLRSRNKASENRDYNLVANQNRFQKSWRAPIKQCSDRASRMDLDERTNEQGEGNDRGGDPSHEEPSRSSAGNDPGDGDGPGDEPGGDPGGGRTGSGL
ncbi:MAG: hypothetical protein GY742_08040 [Hyphomicrobiales bacterium]|nr:hypothetical protein [Hyphomicrobiales bacterium]